MTRSIVQPGLAPRGGRWFWRSALPPAVCFASAQVVLWCAAVSARASFWSTGAFVRWDAFQYLDIAKHWYYVIGCPSVGYPKASVCGNAGWFPTYPLLISGLHRVGVSRPLSAVLLAAAFQLAVLVVVWASLGTRVTVRTVATLFFASSFLSEVYLRAAFPISMCVLFLLLSLVLIARRRWALAAACGAIAAASYPTAVILAPAVVASALLQGRHLLRPSLVVALVTVGGFASVVVVQDLQTHRWDAFFEVQQKYGNGMHEPVSAFVRSLDPPSPPPCARTQTDRKSVV